LHKQTRQQGSCLAVAGSSCSGCLSLGEPHGGTDEAYVHVHGCAYQQCFAAASCLLNIPGVPHPDSCSLMLPPGSIAHNTCCCIIQADWLGCVVNI
jgi:hypothetical protein